MRVHSIKDRLDSVIHKLADKNAKSKDDGDLEKSLIGGKKRAALKFVSSALDKKNCIIDELNKVLVTSERVATTLPAPSSGLEAHCPLIFLDSSELDSTENLTELDEFLPVIGDTYFLPKEQSEDYIDLPILHELGINTIHEYEYNPAIILLILENEIGVVATWDSSAHDNSKLNRVTPDHEKLYMIVKVVVRISDPSPMGNICEAFFA